MNKWSLIPNMPIIRLTSRTFSGEAWSVTNVTNLRGICPYPAARFTEGKEFGSCDSDVVQVVT